MASDSVISLRGVRVHNLRSIDVDIPLGKLTAVTGVSGAGKSSLVFDTLFAEAQRRYLQSFSVAIRQQLERFDQPDADRIGDLPPAIAVRRTSATGSSHASVGSITEIRDWLHRLLARAGTVHCRKCGQPVVPSSVESLGATLQARPAGQRLTIAFPSKPEANQDATAWAAALREDGFVRLQIDGIPCRLDEPVLPPFDAAKSILVLVDRIETGNTTADRLRDSLETAFARGADRLALIGEVDVLHFDRRWRCPRCDLPCAEPQPHLFAGDAPSEDALSVHLHGNTIADLIAMPLSDLATFVQSLSEAIETKAPREQLLRRLRFLLDVELGYLHVLRKASTLSAGEATRLQLCAALTNNLVGALYLLDEPSAGLHPRDADTVLAQLHKLRDAGSTVVMIEHHAGFIRAADHVIDLGPGAGEEGGRVVAQGPIDTVIAEKDSVTGEYLQGRDGDAQPVTRRKPLGWLHLHDASWHNLRDLSIKAPLGVLGAITGVSGAGKRSLIVHTLYPLLARIKDQNISDDPPAGARLHVEGNVGDVLFMDQEPLPRSARSNAVTYLKIFDDIRALFAETAEAKIRGFGAGHFSFNQPGGRCDACEGQGSLAVDMQFLADVAMTCPECHGTRFKKDILNVKVRNLSIAEVLNLTVREAFRFFRAQRRIEGKLKWLLDVGLEYLRLGQATETLSGGECQRLKLAGHLASSRKPRCLFILVEPTAGLHPADVERLLNCLDRLVQTGHTVLVIEYNLDVIQAADYIIDLGPGAGSLGGRIVATGTPEEIAAVAESATGQHLQRRLRMR